MGSGLKKWTLTVAVFVCTLMPAALLGLFLGLILVGPHSDMLPGVMQVPTGLLLWAAILGFPTWLASKTYRKCRQREKEIPAKERWL